MTDPAKLYAQLIAAFNQHQWLQAQKLAGQLLPMMPNDAGANYLAGIAHLELQQLPSAISYLRKANRLEPRRPDFAVHYAKALAVARQMAEARLAADRALEIAPDDPQLLDTIGVVYSQANAFEQAAAVFQRVVTRAPDHAPFRFNLAYSLITIGDTVGAERELEACIALDHRLWRAHLSLAQLRLQTPTANHLKRLTSLVPAYQHQPVAQMYLNMALAKEYEDTRAYPEAFEHFTRAKTAGRRPSSNPARHESMTRDEQMFAALIHAFPAEPLCDAGDPTDEPIFIIGMPRTGTTLLERILSSHPDVTSAGELQNFPVALQHAAGGSLPILFDPALRTRVARLDWRALGGSYLESTRPVTGRTPRFIDKLPHNFLYAGFIARALPNARIICLRRDPMDACLGNFRHLFEQESSYYDYSFDLLDTGRYYVLFDRLMAHWQRAFPARILEVSYEGLVDSQEASSRQLVEFCGLPWDDACLHFEENAAAVNTPNAWQVRAPIYRGAVKRWKNFEPQLGALRMLLEEAGIVVDD